MGKSKKMKSLLFFLTILPFVCKTMEGRYLLVKINDQDLNDHKHLNETDDYSCEGVPLASTKSLDDAKVACNKHTDCGCVDAKDCSIPNFTAHAKFTINKNGPGEHYCAWVRS